MSKRSERREADRLSRKLAYQQLRQQPPAAAQIIQPSAATLETSLLAKAQAYFECPEPSTAISEAQLQANRENAKLSTGPVTPEGRAISARNNTRHGLASGAEGENFHVLPTENQSAYDKNLAAFRADWKPNTATEHDLVNRMVMHQWLNRRALRLQETLFDSQTGEVTDVKKFDLYRRYETSHERAYNKALADIQRLRAFQLRQQNGFESQARKNKEHEFKMRRLQREENLHIHKIAAASVRFQPKHVVPAEAEIQRAA